jgi:hypothetical protein
MDFSNPTRKWLLRLGLALAFFIALVGLSSLGGTWSAPASAAYTLPSWCPSVPTVPTIPTVPTVPTFSDVPQSFWAWEYIEVLAHYGYVTGYPDGNYHPTDSVTRAQMAVYVENAAHGTSYTPTVPTVPPFPDVPTSFWASSWIDALKADGYTVGAPDGNYHPLADHTRAETAVFFTLLHNGTGYSPTVPSSPPFPDVPVSFWASSWINQVLGDELVSGYPDGNYHPTDAVTRAQMAVFMVRVLCLPGLP